MPSGTNVHIELGHNSSPNWNRLKLEKYLDYIVLYSVQNILKSSYNCGIEKAQILKPSKHIKMPTNYNVQNIY